MKPKLKAPGTWRLKRNNDKLLSSFAFNFNLRRYTMAYVTAPAGFLICRMVGRCNFEPLEAGVETKAPGSSRN
jgi:hypothetical protein